MKPTAMTSALDLRLHQLSKPLTSSDQGRATEQSLPQAITTPTTADSATESSPTDSIDAATNRQARPRTSATERLAAEASRFIGDSLPATRTRSGKP